MAKKAIDDASASELQQFAETVLGIQSDWTGADVDPKALTSRIRDAGFTGNEIDVPDVDAAGRGQVQRGRPRGKATTKQESNAASDMVTIRINDAAENESNDPVFVAVNGRGVLLPRGKDIKVKRAYVEVLQNARKTVYPENREGNGGLHTPREVHAYPFMMVG